jgi:hypothetical protein
MAYFDSIANKSIRDQIKALADKTDELASAPGADVSELTRTVRDLGDQVRALNVAINGEPAPIVDTGAPLPQ